MANKLRSLTVNFNAGTARFNADVDNMKAKIRDFGGEARASGAAMREFGNHTVSNMQASSAAIRTVEGNIQNNVRAVERFLTNVLPLGPALQAAFPVIGAVAFLGLVTELTKKANEFFRDIREAPQRIATAFNASNAGLRLTNAELQVTNDRLENDIAKLEGKRQNNLKLALDEAVASAAKLGVELDKDLESLHKLIAEDSRNWFQRLIGSEGDFGEEIKKFRSDIQEITNRGVVTLAAAGTDPTAQRMAKEDTRDELYIAYNKQIAATKARLAAATPHVGPQYGALSGAYIGEGLIPGDEKDAALAKGALGRLEYEKASIGLREDNGDLAARKSQDEIARRNEKLDRPLDKMISELKAKVAEAAAELNAAGLDSTSKMIAKAEAEAIASIEHVNQALKGQGQAELPLDPTKSAKGREALELATTEQDLKYRTALADKVRDVTDAIADQIKTQQMLNEAIGKGWEAQKKVNIEVELMKKFGHTKYETAAANPLSDEFAAVSAARSQVAAAVGDAHTTQVDERLRKLQNEIDLENVLTQAQSLGAYAVEKAALAEQLRQQKASTAGLTAEEEQKKWLKFYAERANKASAEIFKIDQEIAATERLAAAQGQGAEAARKAALENKYVAMAATGAKPEVIDDERKKDAADWQAKLTEEALKTGMAYQNAVEKINLQLKALDEVKVTEENIHAIEIARRDLGNQRLDQLAKESLAMRGARDGMRAFFLEMQKDAESAAEIVYKSLNSAVDRVSGNLGKLFTGQKTDWAKSFRDIGEGMVQSTTKNLLAKGIGAIGKRMGISGQPDGTSAAKAWWVRWAGLQPGAKGAGSVAGGSRGGFSGNGGLLGTGQVPQFSGDAGPQPPQQPSGVVGILKSLFMGKKSSSSDASPSDGDSLNMGDWNFMQGGGDAGEGAMSSLGGFDWGGFMANGGMMSPASAYVVGDQGPEVIAGLSARVVANGDVAKMFGGGGGGVTQHFDIDARGADLGAHNRIMRGVEASSRAAVAQAQQAVVERSKRVPKR